MLLTKKRESTLRAQVLVKKFLKVIQSYSKLLKLIAINSLNINITYWFTPKVSGSHSLQLQEIQLDDRALFAEQRTRIKSPIPTIYVARVYECCLNDRRVYFPTSSAAPRDQEEAIRERRSSRTR